MSENTNTNNEEYGFEEMITLSLDDGKELQCAIISIFPAGENEYIALLPVEGDECEEGEVFLYRFQETPEGEPVLDNIVDDDEYEKVVDAFDEILDSMEYDEIVPEDELEEEVEE